MGDLVERLRESAAYHEHNLGFELPLEASGPHIDMLREAADRIATLTRELEEAREALRPFAAWSRLEELHGSTIGHADIADDEVALLVVGELQTRVGTAADLRALHRLSRASDDKGGSVG